MKLTRQEEAAMMEKAIKKLWSYVYSFGQHNTRKEGRISQNDLFQEAAIVYLKHIRAAETLQEAKTIPYKDILNAMSRNVLKSMSYSYPNRTTDFTEKTKSELNRVMKDISEVYNIADDNTSAETVDFTIDLSDYLSTLSDKTRDILKLHAEGFNGLEISRKVGISPGRVSRRISSAAKKYHEYMAS